MADLSENAKQKLTLRKVASLFLHYGVTFDIWGDKTLPAALDSLFHSLSRNEIREIEHWVEHGGGLPAASPSSTQSPSSGPSKRTRSISLTSDCQIIEVESRRPRTKRSRLRSVPNMNAEEEEDDDDITMLWGGPPLSADEIRINRALLAQLVSQRRHPILPASTEQEEFIGNSDDADEGVASEQEGTSMALATSLTGVVDGVTIPGDSVATSVTDVADEQTSLEVVEEQDIVKEECIDLENFVPATFECAVCMEHLGIREFPSSAVTVLCAHEDQRACLNCLHQIVVAALGQGALEQFVCPLCPEQMTRDNVKTYCQDHSDLFDRYDTLQFMSAIPDAILCLGLGCGNRQLHDGGDNDTQMTCASCNFKTCVKHNIPWHSGYTCEEYDTFKQRELSSNRGATSVATSFLPESPVFCPRCSHSVTKTVGCDYMRCRCGTEWCPSCLNGTCRVHSTPPSSENSLEIQVPGIPSTPVSASTGATDTSATPSEDESPEPEEARGAVDGSGNSGQTPVSQRDTNTQS